MTTPSDNSVPLPQPSALRRLAANVGHYSGFNRVMASKTSHSRGWPNVRAINYHQTVRPNAKNFESHLEYYRKHFAPVSHTDLLSLLDLIRIGGIREQSASIDELQRRIV